MRLLLLHPEVAFRDCRHCLKVIYDEETGQPVKNDRTGEYRERDDRCPPLCRTEKGCPKGTPERTKSLVKANELAYQHYRECRAVGEFPDDPIVRRNAAIIRDVEDEVDLRRDRLKQSELVQLLMSVGMVRGVMGR